MLALKLLQTFSTYVANWMLKKRKTVFNSTYFDLSDPQQNNVSYIAEQVVNFFHWLGYHSNTTTCKNPNFSLKQQLNKRAQWLPFFNVLKRNKHVKVQYFARLKKCWSGLRATLNCGSESASSFFLTSQKVVFIMLIISQHWACFWIVTQGVSNRSQCCYGNLSQKRFYNLFTNDWALVWCHF